VLKEALGHRAAADIAGANKQNCLHSCHYDVKPCAAAGESSIENRPPRGPRAGSLRCLRIKELRWDGTAKRNLDDGPGAKPEKSALPEKNLAGMGFLNDGQALEQIQGPRQNGIAHDF
jgi:hypothetical protein